MLGIEMVGGVYCPLSPRDPQHRLNQLLQETQSQLLLVHWLTRSKLNEKIFFLDIDSILINNNMESDVDVARLSRVLATSDSIAYIIFTSGSTGTPKAVSDKARYSLK